MAKASTSKKSPAPKVQGEDARASNIFDHDCFEVTIRLAGHNERLVHSFDADDIRDGTAVGARLRALAEQLTR